MWCWIELSMALLSRLGIWTCSTSPTNEKIRAAPKAIRWAFMIGMARRSQLLEASGSIPARGGA